ncbi:TCP-1/cpn60 chaperonin family protein [Halosimplex aquaticum]|uniref:TCP-1/cpn60 chaperonin family protein n=1 Tax=Halosimplex aquaticum TaxID=3026162 RepID=A0ABD5Y7J4_9EURY|nr:TCP-1/cpn60 chaperonin family protein [Halosimplex aquaticum]
MDTTRRPGDGEATPTVGDEVRRICDSVRSTLGPCGAAKLVVTPDGSVSTTPSGRRVVDLLAFDGPEASLLETAAEDVVREHGDGATTTLLLTGELLWAADELRELGLARSTVVEGFREAAAVAVEAVADLRRPSGTVGFDAVARTALTGVRDPTARATVADGVARLAEAADDGLDGVDVVSRLGGTPGSTDIVDGVVLDRRPVDRSMPRRPERDGVVLCSETVDVPSVDRDVSLDVDGFDGRAAVGEREREQFRTALADLVAADCGFLATERAVNDRVESILGAHGVLAVDRVDAADMERLARATGATVVPDVDHVTAEAMGRGTARVVRKAGRDYAVVEGDADDAVATLFCRAPDPRAVETFEASVESAIAAVDAAARGGTIVPGGGATAMHAAREIRGHARAIDHRRRLAVEAYADALLAVPRTLAANAGADPASALAELASAHATGQATTGVDARTGEIRDCFGEEAVLEPPSQVAGVWGAATDLATQAVRIDERLPASDLPETGPVETDGEA